MTNSHTAAMEAAFAAIRAGDTQRLAALLAETPDLAKGRGVGGRTLLHAATDFPGHYANAGESIRLLVAHGADPNARLQGPNVETPLHWAASCNDVEALDALLDHGADIEADGAVIANGTPLADAVAFAQWAAAERLVERGAIANLWQAAALGLLARVESFFAGGTPPQEEITKAFWCACHGGQLGTAQYLHARGADIRWVGYDHLAPIGAARRNGNVVVIDWLGRIGG